MPLPNRMQFTPRLQIPPESPLQSQPLSPTKLKVSRASKLSISTPKVIEIPPLQSPEEVCLRWNSHHSNMQTSFPHLLQMEKYVDVTLIAEGKTLKCHRMILSSCSPYFEEILSGISPLQHPVVILNGIPFWILKMLTDFMYAGEVNIDQNKVPELLDVAEILKIKGLASKTASTENNSVKKEAESATKSFEKNTHKKLPNIYSTNVPIIPKVENSPINDPLQLLETKFIEVPLPKRKEYKAYPKKIIHKKIRKRKSSDEDEESSSSPPVFPIRRGTRSRPYVKVPKYYDYEDIVKPMGTESPQDTPLSPINIKSEPPELNERESHNLSEIQTCSDIVSEYTDINDIASKLQSLEKSLEIQPIPSLLTKIASKPSAPFKIKVKSLSSISDGSPVCTTVKESTTSNNEFLKQKDTFVSIQNDSYKKTTDTLLYDSSVSINSKMIEIVAINPSDPKPQSDDNVQV